jgi:hypothetical protein
VGWVGGGVEEGRLVVAPAASLRPSAERNPPIRMKPRMDGAPATQGNPPSASWDDNPGPNGVDHWDVKHGPKGPQQTDRYDEHGNPLTPDQAHGRPPRNANPMSIAPSPSLGAKAANAAAWVGIGIIVVIITAFREVTQ